MCVVPTPLAPPGVWLGEGGSRQEGGVRGGLGGVGAESGALQCCFNQNVWGHFLSESFPLQRPSTGNSVYH